MTEEELHSVDVLNRLYAAEKRSLLRRLAELSSFAPPAAAAELDTIARMIAEQREHQAWLAEAIQHCGGVVGPAPEDITTAHLHYLELWAVLPRVIDGVHHLIRLYEESASQSPRLTPAAVRLIARIGARHQQHLWELERMLAAVAGPASGVDRMQRGG